MNTLFWHAFILFVVCGLGACSAPAEEPQALEAREAAALEMPLTGPATERLVSFIEAIRTGNRDSISVLIRDHMAGFLQEIPVEEHIDQLMDFHTGFSQIEFHGYVRDEPQAAQGRFYNTHMDSWVLIGVEVEKEAPHRIFMISLEPGSAPE